MSFSKPVSSSDKNSNNIVKVVGGLAALAVVGGAVYWFLLRDKSGGKGDLDDNAIKFSSADSSSLRAPAAAARPPQAANAGTAGAVTGTGAAGSNSAPLGTSSTSSSQGNLLQSEQSMFAGNTSFGGDTMFREDTDAATLPGVPNEQGQINFPSMRMILQLAKNWHASEDVAPMPTTSMVQLQHEDYVSMDPQRSPPGSVPMVMVMVEDTASEGITFDEQKEKQKVLMMQQLAQMGGGMFPPRLTKDSAADVGTFSHLVEIEQKHFAGEILVIQYTAMVQGLFYTFQMVASPSVVQKLRPDFAHMVRSLRILQSPGDDNFQRLSYIVMPLKDKKGTLRIPTPWSVAKEENKIPNAIVPKDSVLAAVQSPSASKPEVAIVTTVKPKTDVDGVSIVHEKEIDGVQLIEIRTQVGRESPKHIKIFKAPGVDAYLVSGPTTVHNMAVHNELFAHMAASISLEGEAVIGEQYFKSGGFIYHSPRYGLEFYMKKGSRIMESRLGDTVIVYAPLGGIEPPPMGQMPDEETIRKMQEQPMVTIRIGDPSNDEDCRATLDEWEANVVATCKKQGQQVVGPDRVTHGDREFLRFSTKEMVEVGMGQREERVALMFVTMHGLRSTMVRWEAPTGVMPRYTEMINEMLRSVKLFDLQEPAAAAQ